MKNTLSPASHELQVKGRENLILNINWETGQYEIGHQKSKV